MSEKSGVEWEQEVVRLNKLYAGSVTRHVAENLHGQLAEQKARNEGLAGENKRLSDQVRVSMAELEDLKRRYDEVTGGKESRRKILDEKILALVAERDAIGD